MDTKTYIHNNEAKCYFLSAWMENEVEIRLFSVPNANQPTDGKKSTVQLIVHPGRKIIY